MRLFKYNSRTIQEKNGELKKSLAELDCEKAIISEKERFGRVRKSVMKVLRGKFGHEIANRTLSRVNKRTQQNYFEGKSLSNLYMHSRGLLK